MLSPLGLDNEKNRDTWVRRTLAAVPAGWRLLDAGAGSQPYRDECRHLTYVSQDFAAYDGSGNRVGLQTGSFDYGKLDLVCDIANIPGPDGSFDAVLCTEVLEHVPSPEAALREFSRLLRPGGRLIMTAPFCSLTHFSPYFFATGFSRYFYESRLPALGFAILELSPNGSYFDYFAQELRRLPSVGKDYAGTRLSPLGKIARRLLMRDLERYQRADRDSSQLLCYGWHVVAERLATKPATSEPTK